MESIGSEAFDLDLGRRLVIIVAFLLIFWFVINYYANKIKSGELEIPEFLKKKVPGLKSISEQQNREVYQMNIIQRKHLVDGNELIVLDVDGRHILLSKHINTGLTYITDLNDD